MTHDKKRLLSIGEAAKALEVTRRMILNYEDKGLILPDQRDGINGNRYYTADTVSRIRSIRILQNLGLSLDDIYAYYHGTTDLEPLITRLEDLRDEISRNIEKLKEQELQIFIIVSLVIFSIFPTIFYFEIVQDSGKGIVQMVLLYIIGRYIRLYKNFPIARWKCLLALLFLWVINTISIMYPIHLGGITHSLCRDNSITNLAMTIILFYLFKYIIMIFYFQ